ncbi:hypothetical protein ABQF35_28615 [Mycobacterium syngnathidarum]
MNSPQPRPPGISIVEWAARNVDHAVIEANRQDEAARATTERIKSLRHIVFRDAVRGNREIEALRNEPAAARLIIRASESADHRAVLGILQVAIDNRWSDVVKGGTRYFGESPIAALIQELWNLTTGYTAV